MFNVIDWNMQVHLDCDIIVFQRNMFADIPERMKAARAAGQILVNDIDDWFWGLSPSNGAFRATHPKHNPGENIQHYKSILGASSAVLVSTPYLRERLSAWVHCPIEVLPNVIDVDNFTPHVHEPGVPTVGWVGSTNHRSGDLGILRGILRGPLDAGQIKLHHSGHLSAHRFFADEIGVPRDLVTTSPMVAPADYPNLLSFDIGLAPLTDVPFNQAKCVDADTRIFTQRGILRAADIEPGDSVIRGGALREVRAVSREPWRSGLRITTGDGRVLVLTPEHRMRVDGAWKQAQDIFIGDTIDTDDSETIAAHKVTEFQRDRVTQYLNFRYRRIASDIPSKWIDVDTFEMSGNTQTLVAAPVDGTLAYVMGAFASRAWTRGDSMTAVGQRHAGAMRFELPIGHLAVNRRLYDRLTALEIDVSVKLQSESRMAFECRSPALHRALHAAGLIVPKDGGSYRVNRCVPEVIWQSDSRIQRSFLRGFLEVQGCEGKEFSLPMRDSPELDEIQRLAFAVGIPMALDRRPMMTASGEVLVRVLHNALPEHSATVVSIEPIDMLPVDIQVDGEEFNLFGFVSHNSWIKAIEYAAAGIPFIATDIAPYRELYDQYGIGRLARRPKHWIAHVRELLDVDVRAEEAARNRELVRSLDLAHGQKRWDDFFEELYRYSSQA